MTRLTVDRSAIRAEVERRKAVQTAVPAPEALKSQGTTSPKRWSAKVFVVPASVAQAIAKLANHSVFGLMNGPHVVGERHSMRRHRGVYIWRPVSDQQGEPGESGEVLAMQDVHTAETEIAKLRKELH